MVTLERKALEVPEIDISVRDLAERAKSELGYEGLMKRWDVPLARVLRELEVEPFSLESVKKYQAEMAEEGNQLLEKLRDSYRAKTEHNKSLRTRLRLRQKQQYTQDEEAARVMGTQYQWRSCPLPHYRGAVPEFVVSKALEIKTKLPETKFAIEYLEYRYDPFLTAYLGNELYYVEVWDEPRFDPGLVRHVSLAEWQQAMSNAAQRPVLTLNRLG